MSWIKEKQNTYPQPVRLLVGIMVGRIKDMFHKRSQRTRPRSKIGDFLEDPLGTKEDITKVTANKDMEVMANKGMEVTANRDTDSMEATNLDMDNKEDIISSNNPCMFNSSVTPEEQRAAYWRA